MARPLFARGAKGHLIGRVQRALAGTGFYTGAIDGDYGAGTERAVGEYQHASGVPVTGRVDDGAWTGLMHSDIPALFERCLQLTARIEGHGFTMVAGNFDGAGITWGIIGFTLKHGEIQRIVREVFATNPGVVQRAFGDRAEELMRMMAADWPTQSEWADSISSGPRNATVVEPWRSAFARFGSEDLVQASQLARARDGYFASATRTAERIGLTTELGVALCFDVHVQNGGVKKEALEAIEAERTPETDQQDLRILVAEAVADNAAPTWRNDVRTRKLAIATGAGAVHGEHLVLESWGLGEYPA
jgi:peptidoglycan hydrolase-like protein with peptidoglycan-binding domain